MVSALIWSRLNMSVAIGADGEPTVAGRLWNLLSSLSKHAQ